MFYAFQLGRLPHLGKAELHAVFPGLHPVAASDQFIILAIESGIRDPQLLLDRLGGTIRIGIVRRTTEPSMEQDLVEIITQKVRTHAHKSNFGISLFGDVDVNEIPLGLSTKKDLHREGHSSRFVQGRHHIVPTAAVIHNRLVGNGVEAIGIEVMGQFFSGLTAAIQNIEAYTNRDANKPVRDMKRGMMPPKLAQVMINIARIPANGSLLDPFCGTGTILMESLIDGYGTNGSDIDTEAVRASIENTAWIRREYPEMSAKPAEIRHGDAQHLDQCWPETTFDAIVTEGHLGPVLSGTPSRGHAHTTLEELIPLYRSFFASSASIIRPGGSLVIATPVFRLANEKISIPHSNFLATAGTAWSLNPAHAHGPTLFYERDDQFVGREIWTFRKL